MGFKEMAPVVNDVHTLRTSEKFCLAMIADRTSPAPEKYGDEIPRAEIWVAELCRRTELSRSTVHRHLNTLEEQNLIHREKQWGVDAHGRPTQRGSLVALNLPAIENGDYLNGCEPAGRAKGPKMRPTMNPFESPGQSKGPKMRPTNESQKDGAWVSNTGAVSPTGATGEEDNQLKEPNPPKPPAEDSVDVGQASAAPTEAADAVGEESQESGNSAGHGAMHYGNEVATDEDRALVDSVLPREMRALPANAVPGIARLIRERLDSGWTTQAMHDVLDGWQLPPNVRSISKLVASRFRKGMPVDNPPAYCSSDQGRVALTTSDGKAVELNEIDVGALAQAYHAAVDEGQCSPETGRWDWANQVGVENFLI